MQPANRAPADEHGGQHRQHQQQQGRIWRGRRGPAPRSAGHGRQFGGRRTERRIGPAADGEPDPGGVPGPGDHGVGQKGHAEQSHPEPAARRPGAANDHRVASSNDRIRPMARVTPPAPIRAAGRPRRAGRRREPRPATGRAGTTANRRHGSAWRSRRRPAPAAPVATTGPPTPLRPTRGERRGRHDRRVHGGCHTGRRQFVPRSAVTGRPRPLTVDNRAMAIRVISSGGMVSAARPMVTVIPLAARRPQHRRGVDNGPAAGTGRDGPDDQSETAGQQQAGHGGLERPDARPDDGAYGNCRPAASTRSSAVSRG